jgi:tetratricopeptide (TPR) repeat protein
VFHQGVLLHLAGDLEGAEEQYRRGTDRPPFDGPSAANLLGIYLMKGEASKARALIDRVLPPGSPPPALPELAVNAAAVLLETGETAWAATLLEPRPGRGDNTAAAAWNRAVLAWKQGDAAAAGAASAGLPAETGQLWSVTASRAAWDNGLAERIAGQYATAPGGDRRLAPLAANFDAYARWRAGKTEEAEKRLADAAGKPGSPPELLSNLGWLRVERGKWKEGRETLERVTREHPSFPEGWYNLGLFREVYAGDAAGALECYRRYVNLGGSRKDEVARWIEWLQRPAPPSSP